MGWNIIVVGKVANGGMKAVMKEVEGMISLGQASRWQQAGMPRCSVEQRTFHGSLPDKNSVIGKAVMFSSQLTRIFIELEYTFIACCIQRQVKYI